MTTELLPCPYCGGTDLHVSDNVVTCNPCGGAGPDLGHCVGLKCRAEAIAAWNRRAPTASCEELRKALSEARTEIATRVEVDKIGWGISAKSALLARIDAALATPEPTAARAGQVIAEIAAERRRQVEAEGWTAEHDDRHADGAIARAAAAYIFARTGMIKAGALIVAEIERLDRAALTPTDKG